MTWAVERFREDAGTFHARDIEARPARSVWRCDPTGAALVLGSAQDDAVVDRLACARAGVDVVRRRSGGGAVLVEPERLVWVDIVLPAGDPEWQVDVGRAFHWLGDVWGHALADLGVAAEVHHGGLLRTTWSRLVCFAGLGPGEVTLAGGPKVVGISQRRTRAGARFQCAALLEWRPTDLLALLALDDEQRAAAAVDLAGAAVGLPVDPDALLAALLRHLP